VALLWRHFSFLVSASILLVNITRCSGIMREHGMLTGLKGGFHDVMMPFM
jgi:hypothetical protein